MQFTECRNNGLLSRMLSKYILIFLSVSDKLLLWCRHIMSHAYKGEGRWNMHYELYILKCKSNWQRIFLGGGLGSGMMCLGIVVGIPGVFQLIFFHGIVSSCMLITGLRIRTKAQFIKAYILLYLCAVFMGGMMTAFRPYLRYISLFYGTAVGTAFLFVKCWKLLRKISGKEQVRCEVTLYLNERKMSVMALMDTGNLLCDPVSGDPVSILDHEFYEKFREQQQKEGSVLRDTEPKMR